MSAFCHRLLQLGLSGAAPVGLPVWVPGVRGDQSPAALRSFLDLLAPASSACSFLPPWEPVPSGRCCGPHHTAWLEERRPHPLHSVQPSPTSVYVSLPAQGQRDVGNLGLLPSSLPPFVHLFTHPSALGSCLLPARRSWELENIFRLQGPDCMLGVELPVPQGGLHALLSRLGYV